MKKIKLTKNKFTIVDDEDYEKLRLYTWHATPVRKGHKGFYATTNVKISHNKYKKSRMHREIMQPQTGMVIDHIDGDSLNNQRSNLRICTVSENVRNCSLYKTNTSGFKGVHWNQKKKRWVARVRLNGKAVLNKMFVEKIDAVKAYNEKAKEYFGEFARINSL